MEDASEHEKQMSVWAARERHTSVRSWWEDLFAWPSPPLTHGTHRSWPQPRLLFWLYRSAIDFFFFPQKIEQVTGSSIRNTFQALGGISCQLKPRYNHRSTSYFMASSRLPQKQVQATTANLKLNNGGKFRLATSSLRFGLIQLSYRGH